MCTLLIMIALSGLYSFFFTYPFHLSSASLFSSALPFTNYVIVDKLPNLSVSQFFEVFIKSCYEGNTGR